MKLKDSLLVKMNESFALGDDDILKYYGRMCYQILMIFREGSLQNMWPNVLIDNKLRQNIINLANLLILLRF